MVLLELIVFGWNIFNGRMAVMREQSDHHDQ